MFTHFERNYNALFLWAYSYIVFKIVESRTIDDIPAETLSSNPHPSYSTTEEVIFLVVMIYQYFTFFAFLFHVPENMYLYRTVVFHGHRRHDHWITR
jgi:hypothetical protein